MCSLELHHVQTERQLTKERVIYMFEVHLTSLTASCAASLVQNVRKAYPLFRPLRGSIIRRRSQIGPAFSKRGTNSSSNKSLGIFPTKICSTESGDKTQALKTEVSGFCKKKKDKSQFMQPQWVF